MPATDFFVIAYDIVDDKRRLKVAKQLERVGERVQHSVFEVYLTSNELDQLLKRLEKLIDQKEDSVRVYFLCASCRGKIRMIGKALVTPPPGVRIV